MTKILFLDIDGVLCNDYSMTLDVIPFHPAFHIPFRTGWSRLDPKCIARLNQITDITKAKIVISSTWRLFCKDEIEFDIFVDYMKSQGVNGHIIDRTPTDYLGYNLDNSVVFERGNEIQEWLDNTKINVDSFVIIDDQDDMGNLFPFLARTVESIGLQDIDINKAIEILNYGQ